MQVNTIGRKIALARKKNKYTRIKLAELLPVSYRIVRQWESNELHPNPTEILLLADVLKVEKDYFYENLAAKKIAAVTPKVKPASPLKRIQSKKWYLEDSFKNYNLVDFDFSEKLATKKLFLQCDLQKADFSNSNFTGSSFKKKQYFRSQFQRNQS